MSTMTKTRLHAPALDELDPEERMSRDEIQALQLRRLQKTVRLAYANVPLYTRKFDAAGVHPDDIRTLEDVNLLPFTTKDDLRVSYPFGMFAVPMDQVARIHTSSGTTGLPTVVGYTKNDLAMWAGLVARSLRASGVRPGMRVHNAYGYGLFTGGLGAHAGIEALGATAIPMSGGQTNKQVKMIQDFEPDVIMATPSYLLTITDAMVAAGMDPRGSSLKAGVLGAEPWTNQMRLELEDRLDFDALDIYGLSEVMGPGVGNECIETKDGPHLWEDNFLPEVIDGDTSSPCPGASTDHPGGRSSRASKAFPRAAAVRGRGGLVGVLVDGVDEVVPLVDGEDVALRPLVVGDVAEGLDEAPGAAPFPAAAAPDPHPARARDSRPTAAPSIRVPAGLRSSGRRPPAGADSAVGRVGPAGDRRAEEGDERPSGLAVGVGVGVGVGSRGNRKRTPDGPAQAR